ncbi:LytTR family DNA-binding domain-containing protein [Novosphingobium guangzhouense]|uniref:HTH LytTR-type domain-containing protein n=1 Tax=Novosphingobium guangzhouense TaxID=1850347 RepID=A0A2K2G3B0_9SPHN|nr:LytTR family DNA-binding domain-containing protein [Novosphingobium guangzhouense]PNU05492.1 hypothetical protein A8V01_16035 [Novosphingobium guangzhouense]
MHFARHWNRGSPESEFTAFIAVLLIIEAFALPLGWLNAGRTTAWPTGLAIMFWVGAGIVNLATYELATRAARVVMKPWHPSLIAVLVGGAVMGTPVLELCKHLYVEAFQATLVGADLRQPLPSTSPAVVIQRQVLNIGLWVLINGVLVHFHGMRRFGYVRMSASGGDSPLRQARAADTALAEPVAPAQPAFMARIRKPIGPIWAMIAEEHYLRVIGEHGEDLILYRISDAVAELEGRMEGARVHRSYWVASAAVKHSEKSGSSHALVLRNGMRIPVSRGFRSAAAEAGLL